jgi:hypothetical protein
MSLLPPLARPATPDSALRPFALPALAKPKLDTMNADLKKQGVYGGNEQKQVTAWAAIRNSAAHAQYGDYTVEQVKLMIQWTRHFISCYPA